MCAAAAGLAGITIDLSGGRIYSPQAEAEATRISRQALDESLAREIERQAAADARLATATSNAMIAIAGGIAALIVATGGAMALIAWISKRATSVYPNAAGQYPVIIRRGFGWVTFHDPNRSLGPAAVYRTPTLLDIVIGAIKSQPQSVAAQFPASADNQTMTQIATQAQAIGLMAAATRPQGLLSAQRPVEQTAQLVQAITNKPTASLPPTRVATADQWRIHVDQMLLEQSND